VQQPARKVKNGRAAKIESQREERWRYVVGALLGAALIYSFLAALRTIYDIDLGWQLATGRWIVQHHRVPSVDVLSYTAQGRPWIYPALSGVLLYWIYLLGGYAGLSWLTAVASATTTFFLTRERNVATLVLAIIAVPVVVLRLTPRADLFSTVLFAVVLSMLWRYYRSGQGRLWLLPLILMLWVNLHWGFVTGLGLCGAYVMLEAGEMIFASRREAAKQRLKKAWPWLGASALATLVNPWGVKLYLEMFGWTKDLASSQSAVISEFSPLRFTWSAMEGALAWRDPDFSAIWWLLAAALAATAAAMAVRNYGAVVLLVGSAVAGVERNRFQGLFACVVVVVAGSVVHEAWETFRSKRQANAPARLSGFAPPVAYSLCFVVLVLTGVRSFDLVSNRYYLNKETTEAFGTGLSWWYPERAAGFVEREHLPGNIFNVWSLGGYLAWRLPQYSDFIDGRGKPFTKEVFSEAIALPSEPPDSAAWQQAADTWGLQTIVVAAGRYAGLVDFPNLKEFCDSQSWRPVYLDEVSAVFVRRSALTQALIDRLQLNCETFHFIPPQENASGTERLNFWSNAAVMMDVLGRPQEALPALDTAEKLAPWSGPVRFERGTLLGKLGSLAEAERELRESVELRPDENCWSGLSSVLWAQQRYDEAAEALNKAAELSLTPQRYYVQLARLELQRGRSTQSLAALDVAMRFSVVHDDSAMGAEFQAEVAEGRAQAWFALGDMQRAAGFEEQAVRFTPDSAERWRDMANLYQALGRSSEAEQAMRHAQESPSVLADPIHSK